MSSNQNKYYVYEYVRDDGSPYYIGKGTGYRTTCKHSSVKVPRDRTKIKIITSGLSEDSAFLLEKELILYYGRIDKGTGILRNMTDGGEGNSGLKHTDESRKKMSVSQKNRATTYDYSKDRTLGNRNRYGSVKYWFYHEVYGIEYLYITDLSKKYGITPHVFYQMLKGKGKTGHGWVISTSKIEQQNKLQKGINEC